MRRLAHLRRNGRSSEIELGAVIPFDSRQDEHHVLHQNNSGRFGNAMD